MCLLIRNLTDFLNIIYRFCSLKRDYINLPIYMNPHTIDNCKKNAISQFLIRVTVTVWTGDTALMIATCPFNVLYV